jgi:site-specific recombinase XerD
MMLLLYRHGLRETELCRLSVSALDLETARIWIERLKGSLSTHHRIDGEELRAIRGYLRIRDSRLPWLFVTERRGQFTRQGVYCLVRCIGERADLGKVHPHMLRHACGYALANKGHDLRTIQDYLGHRNPMHSAICTRTAAKRFENLCHRDPGATSAIRLEHPFENSPSLGMDAPPNSPARSPRL